MSGYTILSTTPTTYQDPIAGIINGVLVRFRMDVYNEVHEVRVPRMDVNVVKAAIEETVTGRDALAELGTPAKG